MPKQFYFIICSHAQYGRSYILRLVVQRDDRDELLDHYFEYGAVQPDSLILDDSLWSSDPDALVDQMPEGERFHASMDVRMFLRTDLEDALDGSLMTDEFEIIFNAPVPIPAPALAARREVVHPL